MRVKDYIEALECSDPSIIVSAKQCETHFLTLSKTGHGQLQRWFRDEWLTINLPKAKK